MLADTLVKKAVWIVGGDGWAYDIGYGGLDHVLSSRPQRQYPGAGHRGLFQHRRADVQVDSSRRRGQVRRRRQAAHKKDLGLMAMTYGNVYVARVAMGANDAQTVKAFLEAEAYRRAVAHHRLQPLHRPRLRPDPRHGAAKAGGPSPATGRSMRFDPDVGQAAARTRCSSIPSRRRFPCKNTFIMKRATPCWSRAIPSRRQELLGEAQKDVRDRWQALRAPGPASYSR